MDSFESRLAFPEAWRGLRESELELVTVVILSMLQGFLAGAGSLSVAIELVNASIALQSND